MWKTSAFGEQYIEACNRRLFEREPSHKAFVKQLSPEFFNGNIMHIVVGTDSGLLVEHLLQQGLAEGSRYIFVEKDDWLEPVRSRVDIPEDLAKRVHITSLNEWRRIAKAHKLSDYAYQRALRCQRSMASLQSLNVEYAQIFQKISQDLTQIRYEAAANASGMAYTQLQLLMGCDMWGSAESVKDEFDGYTAVVLGAGPTVDAFLPWVKENREKVAVFAVSRLSRRLLEFGITPDFVVTVDPQDLSFYVSREVFRFEPTPVLIHSWHASDMILSQWSGRRLLCGALFPWPSELNKPSFSVRGPTVSNQAVQCALEMGFSQVLIGGLDFCFSREGFSHALGNTERELGSLVNAHDLQIETNDGHWAETTPEYRQAAQTLGEQATTADALGVRLINVGGSSAKVPGIEYCSPEVLQICEESECLQARIERLVPDIEDEALLCHYDECEREIERGQVRFKKMRKLCSDALRYNEKIFDENIQGHTNYKKKMDRVEKHLNRQYPKLLQVVKVFGMFDLLKLDRFDEYEEATQSEVKEAGEAYYKAYKRAIDNILSCLDVAKRRIELRRLELEPAANVHQLVTVWINNAQSGRYRIREGKFGAQEYAKSLAAAKEVFETSLTQSIKKLMSSGYRYGELNHLLHPAMKALAGKDAKALERILPVLENSENKDAVHFKRLIFAYLEELKGDVEAAMALYAELIDSGNELLQEEALNRVALHSLVDNPQQAVEALECLTQFDSKYHLPLGDMLRAFGCEEIALKSYERYLENHPSDLSVLSKQAHVLKKLGKASDAQSVTNKIMDLDPNYEGVKELMA